MRSIIIRCAILVVGLISLTGCGAPKNIELSENFWQEKPKIVIAHYEAPDPGLTVSGNQGLLDMAITRMTNDKVITHLRKSDLAWYPKISDQFAQRLKSLSIESSVDPTPVADSKSIIAKAQGNKILAIRLHAVGIRRVYSLGIISSGVPQAYCVLSGELIDPRNKDKPLWKSEVEIMQPIKEPWNQPENFANLMVALNEATETAKTELLESFFSGH